MGAAVNCIQWVQVSPCFQVPVGYYTQCAHRKHVWPSRYVPLNTAKVLLSPGVASFRPQERGWLNI